MSTPLDVTRTTTGAVWPARAAERGAPAADDFEAQALPHLRALYNVARRLTGSREDAEDLVQEAFLRAYRSFRHFRPGSNIRAWLFTILYRARTDAFRRRCRSPRTSPMVEDGPSVPPGPETVHVGQEDVARALAALPEGFRAAVLLRDVHDFTYDEIARMLGIPIGTVMSRIHRGRSLLRRGLGAVRSAA